MEYNPAMGIRQGIFRSQAWFSQDQRMNREARQEREEKNKNLGERLPFVPCPCVRLPCLHCVFQCVLQGQGLRVACFALKNDQRRPNFG